VHEKKLIFAKSRRVRRSVSLDAEETHEGDPQDSEEESFEEKVKAEYPKTLEGRSSEGYCGC
jgi:hypothetical protein